MTDLLHTIPDFPIKSYTHLIPSLEKHLISTTDLLTLDALELAKRAQLPVLDVRRLASHILVLLQGQLGVAVENDQVQSRLNKGIGKEGGYLRKTGKDFGNQWSTISTLDDEIDETLGGGIPTGYITEVTGESGTGKTQLLLTLLLSAQLSQPYGVSRPTLYISTEHPLPTTRLSQILTTHPALSRCPTLPSLTKILTLQTPDLESQDHILNYQLPVALSRHNIGLIVIDSIAANYRVETSFLSTNDTKSNTPNLNTRSVSLAHRSAELVRLGQHLRNLAREFNVAIVVANQVADRFGPAPVTNTYSSRTHALHAQNPSSSPTPGGLAQPSSSASASTTTPPQQDPPLPSLPIPTTTTITPIPILLTLDHQQRWFTGWGDTPPPFPNTNTTVPSSHTHTHSHPSNLKTPSLGLVWSNQIACRIALIKQAAYLSHDALSALPSRPVHATVAGEGAMAPGEEKGVCAVDKRTAKREAPRQWRRWLRVVYAPWVSGAEAGDKGVEFEVWEGGVRGVRREGRD